ncbi:hypothetical protein BGW38_007881 [Lunasporangiospora selenospora]|uniref:Uncharacterized protein n=1 Tax=Lunasporangiospora selenospora TaxID=979761 RepID=A0A9P6FLU8_9FUNG|nr:hypothetical protein BGW38_007881 [Lunasporangiospora selenospora]
MLAKAWVRKHVTQRFYHLFVSELADLRLRVENERLREENSQLQEQVREYERWMEYIMTKFRLQNEAALRLQEENVMLHTRLADLGAVARRAIHGEYYATETLIEALETENRTLREMLGVASEDQGFGQTNRLLGHGIGDDGGEVRPPGGNRVSFPSTASDHGSEETDERPLQALGPSIQRATTILPSVALTGFAVTTAQSDAAADAAASFY